MCAYYKIGFMLLTFLKNKFSTQNERSAKALKHIILSFVYKGGNMLINLILVPITINFISPEEYGIWLTLSSIIAWFAISDIGFGHGLRNRFAEALANGDKNLARSYVSTAYFAIGLAMVILWISFFFFNIFADWTKILNTSLLFKQELQTSVLIIMSFFVLQFVFKLVGTVLIANQEPGKSAGFDFFANVLILITILLFKELDIKGSLINLAFITGIFQLIIFVIASIWFYSNSLKEYSPSINFFKRKYVKDLLGLGVKFFIIQMSMIFVFQCTNIVITQVINPESVAVYNIAYKYYTIPLTISLIIMSPLWSAFTDAYVKKDYKWMKSCVRNMSLINLLLIIILVLMFFISDTILKLWIGNSIIIAKDVSLSMMITTIFQLISSALMVFINGIGKIKFQVIIYLIFVPIFIPLAILLGEKYGLCGIVYSSAIVYFGYSILFGFQLSLILNNKAKGLLNK